MRYVFWGKVRQGKKRGKDLGFPTANILLHKSISEGIYVSFARINGKQYKSLTFIGSAKTFGENEVKAEVYVIEFNNAIYGEWVSVSLIKKIRGNKKFTSQEELIDAMKKDRQIAIEYFTMHPHV